MSEQILTVLISAGTALLGALIGFVGAQRTTQRTIAQAQAHRRLERAQEMQAEVIPKIFLHLENQAETLAWVLDAPYRSTEVLRDYVNKGRLEGRYNADQARDRFEEWKQEGKTQSEAIAKQVKEFHDYMALNRIWVPVRVATLADELLSQYSEHKDQHQRAVLLWVNSLFGSGALWTKDMKDFEESLSESLQLYEAEVRETKDWLEGERRRQEAALGSVARKVLAVEEYNVEGRGG